jgi:hypothetical protein
VYLSGVVGPLAVHIELILVFPFWQIHDGHKVVLTGKQNNTKVVLSIRNTSIRS